MASGLLPVTNALLGLAFATASPHGLTLLLKATRWLIMQKARSQAFHFIKSGIALLQLVSRRFQVLFHSPPGVLFTFPSRYWCTIGRRVVFSLRRWSSQIPTGFLVSRGTWGSYPRSLLSFRLRGCHPLWPDFPTCSARMQICNFSASLRPCPVRPHYPR